MVTVLMATRNRAALLKEVLEAYCGLQSPRGGWKLIVVDNGSTDNTAEMVSGFRARLPIQYLLESRLGKNAALNTGILFCEGELVVFTDDDVLPHADWLVRLEDSADAHPQYSIFGGVVLPRWESEPPEWVEWTNKAAVFTLTSPSLQEGPVDPNEVYGPNMAVRAEVLRSGARFDNSIGPRGNKYPMGSETEFVLRLSRQGHQCWHAVRAVVEHFIRSEQLRKEWVFRRAIRFGRGMFRLYGTSEFKRYGWFGIAVSRVFRYMPVQLVFMLKGWVTCSDQVCFRAHWFFNYFKGEVIEAYSMSQSRNAESWQ